MLLSAVAFLLITLLPGNWVTFGLPLKGVSFWIKFFIGVILTPVVIAIQFYILRLIGIPFETTSLILLIVNLPPIYLMYRQREAIPQLNRQALVVGILVLVIIIGAIAPFLVNAQARLYTWEAWSQADVVYSFANGGLDLQDAEIAGMRLSYPWVGQVYQAVVSYLSNTPPVTNFIWQNMIWLICIFGLTAGLVAELGGNQFSQVAAAVWLSFGVNFVGEVVQPLLPQAWLNAHATLRNIWGDNRYGPWLDKLAFFGQMYFAMGIFIAVVYLALKPLPTGFKRYYIPVFGLLLCGLALIYPVMLPAACMVIGLKALFILLRLRKNWNRDEIREFSGLALVTLASLALAFIYTKYLTESRTGNSLINLHDSTMLRSRVLESIIVTSPLLAGLIFVFPTQWRKNREKLVILGVTAFGSLVLYTLFDIPWWRNEYKFVFTAAICLAPLPALALEGVFNRLGKAAIPVFVALMLVLAAPFIEHTYKETYNLYTRHGPAIDVSNFNIRLAGSEPLSGLIDAIRQDTPQNSLLAVENADFYYPTLTGRQLYGPPNQKEPYPGILVSSEEMITLVKGYPPQTLKDRLATLQMLFEVTAPDRALLQIMQFNRPLALALDETTNGPLVDWLHQEKIGQQVYAGDEMLLWLIQPDEVKQHLTTELLDACQRCT